MFSTESVAPEHLDRTRAVEAAPSDTSYADQWSLPRIGWDQLYGTVGIAGTSTVAALDTGVDATHPDLDGVVLPGTSVLDGSNGLSDPNGHGIWMAGIVAAETDNGTGILMSFSNPGYSPALQAAVDYAWSHGAVLAAATGNDGSGTATFPAAFMAATGVDIATTNAVGSVATISGTSAAAAEVAGAAALLLANEPALPSA